MILKYVGLFFVGLAIVGAALPVLPTTPFLLVAAACFAKSSPRLYNKLLANKVFGPMIRDWQEHRSMPRKAKRIALLSIALAVAWSCYILPTIELKVLVVALVTFPVIYILRIPLTEHKKSQ